jgi:nitroimidazol reductase NimA-like FMN-containing flavoprotein (pyridoxamine 5'-phosphate oxidase superfamily)
VRRVPDRASYDAESVYAILDAAPIGHAGFTTDERAVVIPMLFGRDGDALYLHGSVASRLQRVLAGGVPLCLTVTLVDGLVLARSAFHHSMNYRSAVVFGCATAVAGDEKVHGLRVVSEHLLAGRWAESREPNEIELRQTSVLRMEIDEASAKVRRGGPIDEPDDYALPIWAGVIPSRLTWALPIAEPDLPQGVVPPAALPELG